MVVVAPLSNPFPLAQAIQYFPGWELFRKYSNVAIVAFFPMTKTKTRVFTYNVNLIEIEVHRLCFCGLMIERIFDFKLSALTNCVTRLVDHHTATVQLGPTHEHNNSTD